jgi:hypothetical protein
MRSGYLARDVSPGSGKASVDSANLFPFGSAVLQLSLRYHHSHDGINSLEISVKNRDTGLERQTTTNEDGTFVVQLLPPGLYHVEASAQGFTVAVVEEVRVQITQMATVNISLAVSGSASNVTVTADTPTLKLKRAVVIEHYQETLQALYT